DATDAFKAQLKQGTSDKYRLTVTTRTSQQTVLLVWPWAIVFIAVIAWETIAWFMQSRKLVRL
ncbi:hypothetical protein QP310_27185, partial [Escherichia coli]|nr:hypothetical protein [Escherichia coli]